MNTCDIIIIGAGPGGYELAAEACARGMSVTLVEKSLAGGTCLNRGCIPTKALLASASVVRTAREAGEMGIEISGIVPSYARAVERKNAIVDSLRDGVMQALKGVEYVEGEARVVDCSHVTVNDTVYSAPKIVIATGSAPASLDIPGVEHAVTSDRLLDLTEIPAEVVIVGGGVIGMEFACILHEFGAHVTVLEYFKEILPPFDKDIAKRLRSSLSRRGIDIVVGAAVKSMTADTVTYELKGKDVTIPSELTLMAVGRRPVIPDGIAEIGVEITRRGIVVDNDMATNIPGIYAIGDATGLCMLAHAATAHGRVLLGDKINLDVIPAAVFTMPECAMVGLTEEQCKERSIDYRVGKAMFRSNGKAVSMGEVDGLVKLIASAGDGVILGCHIMGPHAADMVQGISNMMTVGATASDITHAVHGHPTLSEVLQQAAANIRL